MPIALPANVTAPQSYRARTHFSSAPHCGLLSAWDTNSAEYGLCEHDSIAKTTITDTETIVWVIETPPANTITLAVDYYVSNPQGTATGQPPSVQLQLLAGHGRAASRVLNLIWTPTDWLNSGLQAWIGQYTGRLCSTWWLYAQTVIPQGQAPQAQISVKALIARGQALVMNPLELGPGVAVAP